MDGLAKALIPAVIAAILTVLSFVLAVYRKDNGSVTTLRIILFIVALVMLILTILLTIDATQFLQ